MEGSETVHCPALMRTGRLTRTVELPSVPAVPETHPFWEGLLRWCRAESVGRLEVNSFGSPACTIPAFDGEQYRRMRCEYVLRLPPGGRLQCSTNHVRNIRRARRAGIDMRRTRTADARITHLELMSASMVRRRQRGEVISESEEAQRDQLNGFLDCEAGELCQALVGGTVVSSILVLLAERGAYYHSAGSSAEGMSCGASHALVADIAEQLRAAGHRQFNLGGVTEAGSGLEQFKAGFGADRVPLERAEFAWPRSWSTVLRAGARWMRGMTTVGGR
jgi:hypothetical protein